MHELAICQGLIREVERVANAHRARAAAKVCVSVGALSGVDPQQLARTFSIACAGTLAEGAELEIESVGVRIRCPVCELESQVPPNALVCARCGDWRVQLVCGEELLLRSVELELEVDAEAPRISAAS